MFEAGSPASAASSAARSLSSRTPFEGREDREGGSVVLLSDGAMSAVDAGGVGGAAAGGASARRPWSRRGGLRPMLLVRQSALGGLIIILLLSWSLLPQMGQMAEILV